MEKPTILIGERDEILRQDIKCQLSNQGFKVIEAFSKNNIIQCFQNRNPDLIIINFSLNNTFDGLKTAEYIRKQDRNIPLIMINKHSSEDRVISALRLGINDYFKFPFSFTDLVSSIKRNLPPPLYASSPNQKLRIPSHKKVQFMIGVSESMRAIKTYLLKVAATDSNVLITGETGTGKELAAEIIYRNSPKYEKPFVCINCAALPESLLESELFGYDQGAFTGAVASKRGKFELADGGTIFLDEIGDMSHYAQAKILRTIENKGIYRLGGNGEIPLDIRVIAATNRDLEQMLSKGKFRQDLYYRLNVVRIQLPPLRERKEDIPALIKHYIQELNNRFGQEVKDLTDEALRILLQHDWPGNIRELKNILESIFINLPSRKVAYIDLPELFQKRLKEWEGSQKNERDRLLSALFMFNWNKSKTAKHLHWSRMTLYRKMSKYRIVKYKP